METASPLSDSSQAASRPAGTLRPFGRESRDVDLDFKTTDRLRLAIEILAACLSGEDGRPSTVEDIRGYPISRRIACLLRLASLSSQSFGHVLQRCPQSECLQPVEFTLPVGEVLALQHQADERDILDIIRETDRVSLRRPTGEDQLEWRSSVFEDLAAARTAMLSRLIVGVHETGEESASPRGAADMVEVVERQLEQFDPLMVFAVRVRCPHCEQESNFPVDLEDLALRELGNLQRQLLRDIHRLASTYHWSETQILRLTPRRRQHYLDLIEANAP